MKEVNKKKKGFTLIELLAVIIVLAIILIIAVPNVIKQVEKSRERAFYTSVRNLTDNLKPINVLENKDYCMYDYSYDKENQTELIEKMYILAHMEENKMVYSVYAKSNKGKIIDTYDISKLNDNKPETWQEEIKENSSYSYYLAKLYIDTFNTNEDANNNVTLANYKMCIFNDEEALEDETDFIEEGVLENEEEK